MATKYTLTDLDGNAIKTVSRKDTAINAANKVSLVGYRVVTDNGTVVHEVLPPQAEDAAPAEETADEDLIGETPAEEAPEPGKAEEGDDLLDVKPDAKTKFDLPAMKRKIAALLNKAEKTDNEAERDAFTKKAETLMLRLGIQAAELEAAGEVKAEEIIEERVVYTGIHAKTLVSFTHSLARGFGNLTILQANAGQRKRVVYIIGHKSDVEQFQTLLASLGLQAISALKAFQRNDATALDRAFLNVQEKFVQDRSFLNGFANEVSDRLAVLRTQVEAEASTGAALVLVSKDERIEEHMKKAYPNLKEGRGGREQYSSRGAAAGRTAGKNASLGEKSVGGTKGALK